MIQSILVLLLDELYNWSIFCASLGFGVSVSSLVNTESEIEAKNKTLFDWVKEGDTEQVRRCLASSSDPKALLQASEPGFGGLTVLHVAADRGHAGIVYLLVKEFNADVNATDDDQQTPLHYASSVGHGEVVEILCSAGSKVDVRDGDGYTPEQVAFDHSVKDIFDKLKSN